MGRILCGGRTLKEHVLMIYVAIVALAISIGSALVGQAAKKTTGFTK